MGSGTYSRTCSPCLGWQRHQLSLVAEHTGLEVERLKSGPLGGNQQFGSRIAERRFDTMMFSCHPLEPQTHDPDIKALLRIAAVWNILVACNRKPYHFFTDDLAGVRATCTRIPLKGWRRWQTRNVLAPNIPYVSSHLELHDQ